ncbi:hypothetical protein GIB67_008888 [Kingdonia uniflora]|uniref:Uncharacterized protein n=1 Tax=Kingdonia uniflora TaxID=39325 RepID=A0A7J7LVM5_9MAGN|nr:hypothetical protein GIB67_008888 [Kingdonia uniflora]
MLSMEMNILIMIELSNELSVAKLLKMRFKTPPQGFMDLEDTNDEVQEESVPIDSLGPIEDIEDEGYQKFIAAEEARKLTLMSMGKDWREFKVERRKLIDINDEYEQALKKCPEDVPYNQWEAFVKQCTTSNYKNKEIADDTTSVVKNVRRSAVWTRARRKKNGEAINELDRIDEINSNNPDVGDHDLTEVLGLEYPGIMRAMGFGISPTLYKGVKHGGVIVQSLQEEVRVLREELVVCKEVNEKVSSLEAQMTKNDKITGNAQDEIILPESSVLLSESCSQNVYFNILNFSNLSILGIVNKASFILSLMILTNKTIAANDGKPLPLYQKALCGLTAREIKASAGSPAYLALIRIQADATLPLAQRKNYKNALYYLVCISADKGVTALWKGAGPTVVRAMALNMGMLASYDQSFWHAVKLFHFSFLRASIVSGFFAAVCNFPFDYVKTQIQKMQPNAAGKYPYKCSLDCARKTLKAGGHFKFYTGFSVYYIRIAPHVMFIEEAEQSHHDVIMIIRRALKNSTVVMGGGAIDMEISRYLRQHARTIAGKSQLFINALAKVLEVGFFLCIFYSFFYPFSLDIDRSNVTAYWSSSRLSFQDEFDNYEFSYPYAVDDDDLIDPGLRISAQGITVALIYRRSIVAQGITVETSLKNYKASMKFTLVGESKISALARSQSPNQQILSKCIDYWYDRVSTIGHKLYMEITKVEFMKKKGKGRLIQPTNSYQCIIVTEVESFKQMEYGGDSVETRTGQ